MTLGFPIYNQTTKTNRWVDFDNVSVKAKSGRAYVVIDDGGSTPVKKFVAQFLKNQEAFLPQEDQDMRDEWLTKVHAMAVEAKKIEHPEGWLQNMIVKVQRFCSALFNAKNGKLDEIGDKVFCELDKVVDDNKKLAAANLQANLDRGLFADDAGEGRSWISGETNSSWREAATGEIGEEERSVNDDAGSGSWGEVASEKIAAEGDDSLPRESGEGQ